jgi:four helix bundle protein
MKFQELLAYQKSFALAMAIFKILKVFPSEEKYSLIDQIRRSSRSVSANIAESYAKRIYQKHFISKLTDADAENLETQSWLEFALACNYINQEVFDNLSQQSKEVGKLIYFMINNPAKFGSK